MYDISYFTYKEVQEYNDFLTRMTNSQSPAFFKEPVGEDFWFPNNTSGGYAIFAHTDNEIAATCFLTGRSVCSGNKEILAYEIGGTNTSPNHQRKGLFTKLVKKAVEIAFENRDIALIYGTPNDRSGPGYRKLGFAFTDFPNSKLLIFPKLLRLIIRKLTDRKPSEIIFLKKKRDNENRLSTQEISLTEYVNETKDFTRLNCSSEHYLLNRLSTSKSSLESKSRRFFKHNGEKGTYHFALVNYPLQYLNLILVSEYFYNGKIDHSGHCFKYLKFIAKKFYENFDGIYIKSVASENNRFFSFLKFGYITHRNLPICYLFSENYKNEIQLEELTSVFQMTDCDIG
ncbi:GNAT family N-acetyltransferase [Sneathiella limimaris]|uniref:GNAT family N-acetyltransferase n=1 Tax=Sneathiella limimaris TaxID=1964213 RepID=UPI00146C9661|nr:GNAT family N-acetyltransferase [Sneathiella limimaris]